MREVDRRLGLIKSVARRLGDARQKGKVRHGVETLVRQRVMGPCDGEDYELAFGLASGAARPSFEKAWSRAFPRTRLTCIGRFVRAGQVPPHALTLGNLRGYEHLR